MCAISGVYIKLAQWGSFTRLKSGAHNSLSAESFFLPLIFSILVCVCRTWDFSALATRPLRQCKNSHQNCCTSLIHCHHSGAMFQSTKNVRLFSKTRCIYYASRLYDIWQVRLEFALGLHFYSVSNGTIALAFDLWLTRRLIREAINFSKRAY